MEKQGSTLKRIEVNLCYEVGITQFARISRFLFAAETFIATLLAWRPRLATERSVCDAPPPSLDTLCHDARCGSTPGSRSFAAVRVSASTPGRASVNTGVLFHLVVPCCIATDCMYDCSSRWSAGFPLRPASTQ